MKQRAVGNMARQSEALGRDEAQQAKLRLHANALLQAAIATPSLYFDGSATKKVEVGFFLMPLKRGGGASPPPSPPADDAQVGLPSPSATHAGPWSARRTGTGEGAELDASLKQRQVRLSGFANREDLNGQVGTVVEIIFERGRYAVLLDDGELVNVLPSKVEAVEMPVQMMSATSAALDEARAWSRRARTRSVRMSTRMSIVYRR